MMNNRSLRFSSVASVMTNIYSIYKAAYRPAAIHKMSQHVHINQPTFTFSELVEFVSVRGDERGLIVSCVFKDAYSIYAIDFNRDEMALQYISIKPIKDPYRDYTLCLKQLHDEARVFLASNTAMNFIYKNRLNKAFILSVVDGHLDTYSERPCCYLPIYPSQTMYRHKQFIAPFTFVPLDQSKVIINQSDLILDMDRSQVTIAVSIWPSFNQLNNNVGSASPEIYYITQSLEYNTETNQVEVVNIEVNEEFIYDSRCVSVPSSAVRHIPHCILKLQEVMEDEERNLYKTDMIDGIFTDSSLLRTETFKGRALLAQSLYNEDDNDVKLYHMRSPIMMYEEILCRFLSTLMWKD